MAFPPSPRYDWRPVAEAADAYVDVYGLSVLPVAGDGSKRPDMAALPLVVDPDGTRRRPWTPYRDRPACWDRRRIWFRAVSRPRGIAVITGRASGQLEVVDCDSKAVAAEFEGHLGAAAPGLLAALVAVESPRGRHYYYRCPAAGKSAKLAQAPKAGDPARPATLIDLKAEGGYVVAPPSPGACHPSGVPYTFASAKTFADLPTLTAAGRDHVLAAARRCNRWTPPPAPPRPTRPTRTHADRPGGLRSIARPPAGGGPAAAAFNTTVDWVDVLGPHGWRPAGAGRWVRPGKAGPGSSATVDYDGTDRLYVFSTSAGPLAEGRYYTKFQAYAVLAHGGDFKAAYRAAAARFAPARTLRSLGPSSAPVAVYVPRFLRS